MARPEPAVRRRRNGERSVTRSVHDDQIPRELDPAAGLPIGPRLAEPGPARPPERVVLEGTYARLEPLDPARHRDGLHAASTPPDAWARFRYLPDRPPESLEEFDTWLADAATATDPLYFAVIDRETGRVEGRQTLMRIAPAHRCIEVGNIYWGPPDRGHQGRHRSVVSLRRLCPGDPRLSALRMEMRRAQRAVAPRRETFRFHLGRPLPPRRHRPRAGPATLRGSR